MDDLDDVRAALGYNQINLSAGRMRRGPRRFISGCMEHTFVRLSCTEFRQPISSCRATSRAYRAGLERCHCGLRRGRRLSRSLSESRRRSEERTERLLQGPVEVELKRQESVRISLSRDLVAEAIRYMLYQAGAASRIPLFIHPCRAGQLRPFGEAALDFRQQIVAAGSNGMYLSVTCGRLAADQTGRGRTQRSEHVSRRLSFTAATRCLRLGLQAKIPNNYRTVRSDVLR